MQVTPRTPDFDTKTIDFPEKTTVQNHTIELRPRYAETDQGGVVHHTVYPVWFEMGRTELLRANGLAYSELEKAGVYFVVAEMAVKFRRPALYDEILELTTACTKITTARAEHTYELKRKSNGILLAQGSTILACINADGKPKRMPEFMYPAE